MAAAARVSAAAAILPEVRNAWLEIARQWSLLATQAGGIPHPAPELDAWTVACLGSALPDALEK